MTAPPWVRRLPLIDGAGALAVGALMLALHPWLAGLSGLPRELVIGIGGVNLLYSTLGLSLARARVRSVRRVVVLAGANAAWAVVCAALFAAWWEDASVFGLGHFVLEGAYVAGLAGLEWRHRLDIARG